MGMDMKIDALVSPVRDIYICMISLKKLLTEALLDEVSYKELLRMTDAARKERARKVGAKSTGVRSVMDAGAENTNEAWVFNYKTRNPHSTTNRRYHGKLIFSKQNVGPNDSVEDLDCKVHCDCPDYFYRRQYANYKIGAGTMDPNILGQQHNKQAPTPGGHADIGPGLCKHLVGLAEYLQTKIEPVAPKPDDEPPEPEVKKDIPQKPKPSVAKPTTQAPKPDDTPYSDSRTDVDDTDTYSDSRGLEEMNIPPIWKKMDALVAQHKSFEVPYED